MSVEVISIEFGISEECASNHRVIEEGTKCTEKEYIMHAFLFVNFAPSQRALWLNKNKKPGPCMTRAVFQYLSNSRGHR